MSKRLEKHEIVELRERLSREEDYIELAREFGVSTGTVHSMWSGRTHLMVAGPLRGPVSLQDKPLEVRRKIFAVLYEQGMSTREIGTRHEVDHKTVWRDLQTQDVEMRTPGQARRHRVWEMDPQEFKVRYLSTPAKELALELRCSLRVVEEVASALALYKFEWSDGRSSRVDAMPDERFNVRLKCGNPD